MRTNVSPRKGGQGLQASRADTNIDIDAAAMKPLSFLGSSLDDLRAFPETARREAGHQLDQIRRGLDPDDWKPMRTIGGGVREIRLRDQAGTFRVIYIATRREAVYVLHAFQKKTQATPNRDLNLAEARLNELIRSKR
jgi:phage-related protein